MKPLLGIKINKCCASEIILLFFSLKGIDFSPASVSSSHFLKFKLSVFKFGLKYILSIYFCLFLD